MICLSLSRGDTLDLGEIAAEELSLALEPYPRADGVELSDVSDTDRESLDRPNPFRFWRL